MSVTIHSPPRVTYTIIFQGGYHLERGTSLSNCSITPDQTRPDPIVLTAPRVSVVQRTTTEAHASTMTPPNIPFWYRLWQLYLEPIAALGGTYHLHWVPEEYFSYMPATSRYTATSQIVYDQLASTYLLFAFIEGVVLRVVDDIRVWRYIVFGLALCDAGHIYAAWCEMGTEMVLSPGLWSQKDFLTNFLNVLPFVTRVAFLLGVGVKGDGKALKKA
jgi:hypothetical protein